jgi:hypothetical protein
MDMLAIGYDAQNVLTYCIDIYLNLTLQIKKTLIRY